MDSFFLAERRPDRDVAAARAPLRLGLVGVSLSAGIIHASVVTEHWEESPLLGAFFAAVAALQVAWAIAVPTGVGRRFYLAGIVGNGLLVATWLLSRTAGVPLGPHPWDPEPVGLLDALATGLELGIVAGGLLFVRLLELGPLSRESATLQ